MMANVDSTPHGDAPILEFDGVDKSYREGLAERHVLAGASLRIGAGEIVTLLGRSGSGKSTLLNLASGIDLADAGQVRFEGTDIGVLSERDRTLLRRDRIGFVFQFFNLIPTLTVAENVLLPIELAGGSSRDQRRLALDWLEQVGLADRHDSYPDVLSGGEQQRVAIARALGHQPALLLADEPTGNLDSETADSVLDLLLSSLRANGRAALIASHSRDVARRCDRIVTVEGGGLVEDLM